MTLLTSSQNDSWRTPPRYIEAAREVLNGIDLDPASSDIANETVKAMSYFTKEDDGLAQPWIAGTVWINPPYGKTNNLSNQGLFAHKLIAEHISGNVGEGIILVNIYSGYGWFAPLRTLPMCLVDHRISFIDPATDEEGDEAKASSVFIYVGKDPRKFYQVFKQFGPCGQFSYDW
jgi:phage N-6-adenine-methyltransferase